MAKKLKFSFSITAFVATLMTAALLQSDLTPAFNGEAGAAEPTNYGLEMALGAEDAPLTVIEYASMSCGHCALFHRQTFPELKKHYIDTGKIRFIFREFPINRPALEGAMIARCAGPDRYFGFLKILFTSQDKWAVTDSRTQLAKVVKAGGMKSSTVEQCLDDAELQKSILNTRMQGEQEFEISSTPTFIVNGNKFSGALSFKQFEEILQPLLPAP